MFKTMKYEPGHLLRCGELLSTERPRKNLHTIDIITFAYLQRASFAIAQLPNEHLSKVSLVRTAPTWCRNDLTVIFS